MRLERQFLFWLGLLAATLIVVAALKEVLLPFVVGMILAYALNPVADRLERWGLSRLLASALVLALIVLVVAAAFWFLLPPLVMQMQGLVETMPTAFARLRDLLEQHARELFGEHFAEIRAGVDKALAGAAIDWSAIAPVALRSLWSKGLALVNLLSLLLITPLVVFYLLVDWHSMIGRIESWLPRDRAATITRLFAEMDAAIAAFVRGQGLVCVILGTLYAVGLTWVGLRYGLLIGVATGLLSFVPFAGWALGFLVAAATALMQSWPDTHPLYLVVGVYLAGMALDSALLSPLIVGSRVGLHPLWLILALVVMSYLMGFVGMLLAVPLAAALAVLVRFALEVYLGSDLYRGKAGPGSGSAGPSGGGVQ